MSQLFCLTINIPCNKIIVPQTAIIGDLSMDTPKISVIVPIYNVEKYLPQCMESIIGQTFRDIEIIGVNDGSTDNSLKILQDYAEKDERIKIINQENMGLSAARNSGLKIARAEYIFFIDSDDWIGADTLKTLYDTALETDADLTCCHFIAFAERPEDEEATKEKQDYFDYSLNAENDKTPLSDNPLKIHVVVNGKLHKKSIIDKHDLSFPHQRLIHEDEYWAWAYGIHCNNFSYLRTQMYHYRVHQDSITGTENKTAKPLDIIDIDMLIAQTLQKSGNLQTYIPQLEGLFISHLIGGIKRAGIKYYEKARQKIAQYLEIPYISDTFKKGINSFMTPKIPVSVIIPVYNTASYLPQCLDSILNQSFDSLEVICIDDGSTDNSLEILKKYASSDSRIRIITQQNQGVSAARNKGLKFAQGEYVLFVDSDDWIESNIIEKSLMLMQNGIDILAFSIRLYDTEKNIFNYSSYYNYLNELPYFCKLNILQSLETIVQLPFEIGSKVYRREILQKYGITFNSELQMHEDEMFNLRYILHSENYGVLKEYGYNYRHPRPNSASSSINTTSIEDIKKFLRFVQLFSQIYQNAQSPEVQMFLQRFYFIRIYNIIHNFLVMENKQYYNALRKELKKNKEIMKHINKPCFDDFETVRLVYKYSWYSRKAKILYNSLPEYTKQQIDKFKLFSATMKDKANDMYHKSKIRKKIKTIFNFVKSYFLFPWYVYKIYKMLKKERSKK